MQRAGGVQLDAREGVGQKPADKRPVFPGRIGHVNAQRFSDKSRQNNGADEQKHDHVVRGVVHLSLVSQTVRLLHKTAVKGDHHPDHHKQSEKIHQEGKDQVKIAFQEGPAEERFGDVMLPCVKRGAENQNKKTEKDQGVHNARVGVFQNLVLQEDLLENHFDSFLHVVQAKLRFAHGFPHQPAAVDAEGHDG